MLAILLLAFFFGRPFATLEGGLGFWEGVWAIALISLAGVGVLAVSKSSSPRPRLTEAERKLYAKPWEVVLFVVVLSGPLWEEFVFRYVLIGAMYNWSPVAAVVVSGVLFGVVHTRYKFAKIVKGLGYGWLYVMSGTIWVPFFAHALWNFGCMVLLRNRLERGLYESSLSNVTPHSSS